MIDVPPELPESGRWSALARHLNWIRRVLISLRPLQSGNMATTSATSGTFRNGQAQGAKKDSGQTPSSYERQWSPGSYSEGDEVIRDTTPEQDNGNLAARYYATADVTADDAPPGVGSNVTATATVSIDAGEISGIAITDPGAGYGTLPTVTITGDGTGAEAEATFLGVNGEILELLVTDPGSGYTSASVTIDAPTGSQKWEVSARSNFKKFTMKEGSQRIVLDVGRDDSEDLMLTVYKDVDDETAGSVQINIQDIIDLGAGNKVIKFREWDVCVDGVTQKAIFLSSDAYEPPS